MTTKDVVLSRQFRAWDENFRKSPMWRKIVRQFPKSRVKDFRCFISHLVECCGQCGVSCDDSILSSFEATYGEDPMPLIEYLVSDGFMKYDEPSGWIWLISGVWWQNAAFNGDTSQWWHEPTPKGHGLKVGHTSAISAWKAIQRDVLMRDFPFKREFIDRHRIRLRFDLAAKTVKGFLENVEAAAGCDLDVMGGYTHGEPGSDGGSDPRQGGVRPPSRGGETPVKGGSDGYTETGTRTETKYVGSSQAPARVASIVPTEHAEDGRTDDEDGCHLTHVPHTLDPSPTAAADTEPPRTNGTGVAMGGRAAAVVGTPTITESRKVGGPSVRVRESHPAYGMGDTRPGKPLVTLDQWKALPLDARATLATYPQDGAQDLRDAVAPLRNAVERVVSFYADAVMRSGFDPDAEAFDAVTRSVVLRADRDGAEGAADTLCRLVTWAEANPDKLGKPYKGREAWLSSWVLFGSPEGARGTWQPTTARLTDNLNLMRASEKVAAKAERRKSATASVAEPEPAAIPLEGFTAEEEYELMVYRLKRVTQKSVITPELEARLAEYDAAKASKEAVSA